MLRGRAQELSEWMDSTLAPFVLIAQNIKGKRDQVVMCGGGGVDSSDKG
jgi:hypothetical protein